MLCTGGDRERLTLQGIEEPALGVEQTELCDGNAAAILPWEERFNQLPLAEGQH